MTDLDDELRLALRREEPPPDFAARVLGKLPGERPARVALAPRRRRAPLWGLAAAAAILVALAGWWLAAPQRGAEVPSPQLAGGNSAPAPNSVDGGAGGDRGQKEPPRDPEVKIFYPPRPHPRAPRARRARPAATEVDYARAEMARDQLVLALRITGAKINLAQRRIHEMHREPQS
jgi:hypothetical protein